MAIDDATKPPLRSAESLSLTHERSPRRPFTARASVDGAVSRQSRGRSPLTRAVARARGALPSTGPSTASATRPVALEAAAQEEVALEVAATLLAAGATVNLPSRTNGTPLHAAAAAGSVRAVKLLLANNAAIHARDMNRWSALFHR